MTQSRRAAKSLAAQLIEDVRLLCGFKKRGGTVAQKENNMELRPYQKDCIATIDAQPPGSYLVQMATGMGKTVTFANLPRHGERMLILSHREELVE